MEINELKNRAYDIAVKHGWYDEEPSMVHLTMMVITEFGEIINADRNGVYAQRQVFEENCNTSQVNPKTYWNFCFERFIKDTVEDEFADAVIRILSMAGQQKVTLPEEPYSEEHLAEGVAVSNAACACSPLGRPLTLPEEMFLLVSDLASDNPDSSMGNILFTLLVIAKRRGIDIEWHIEQKMKYNELRPYKHGDKKY